jgi:hypothetical protein
MRKYSLSLPLFAITTLIASGCGSDEPPIIGRYRQFIGGDKNWTHVSTILAKGEYDYGGIKFPFTSMSKAPDSYKFVVPFEGKYYKQAFDGRRGWKIDAFKNETKPTLLTGEAAKELVNESDVELESIFINYKRKGIQITELADTLIAGKTARRITLIRKNGSVERYYFDSDTGALLQKKSRSKNPELNGAMLTTTFTNYKMVEGIRFPFTIEHESNGQKILIITVGEIRINTQIDDKEFQP